MAGDTLPVKNTHNFFVESHGGIDCLVRSRRIRPENHRDDKHDSKSDHGVLLRLFRQQCNEDLLAPTEHWLPACLIYTALYTTLLQLARVFPIKLSLLKTSMVSRRP